VKRYATLTTALASVGLSLIVGQAPFVHTRASASAPVVARSTATASSSIVFAGWGYEEKATKPIFDYMAQSFAAKGHGTVSTIGFPYQNTLQQLVLRYRAGQAPDVAQLDMNWVTTFSKLNALVDLNGVYGKDYLPKHISPTLLKLGQRDGKQVALPWTIASIALVANTSLLRKAGITKVPTTTTEFRSDLATIKKKEPGVIPYALDTKTSALITPFFQPWLWTFGGNMFQNGKVAIDSPEAVKALTYLSGLVADGLVAKDVDIFDARTLFAQGKAAFYDDAIIARQVAIANSGSKGFGQNVVPVARPVAQSGDKPQSIQWGHVLVVFKKPGTQVTANSTAAQFVKYLALDDTLSLKYFKDQGLLPVTASALASSFIKQDRYSSAWAQITKTSRLDETAPYANSAAIGTAIGQNVQAAYLGQVSPHQAIQQLAQQLGQTPLQ